VKLSKGIREKTENSAKILEGEPAPRLNKSEGGTHTGGKLRREAGKTKEPSPKYEPSKLVVSRTDQLVMGIEEMGGLARVRLRSKTKREEVRYVTGTEKGRTTTRFADGSNEK